MLDKISKLLLLAERATTREEAEAALAKAQALASACAIDLAVARAHAAEGEKREEVVCESVSIGKPRQQGRNALIMLLTQIAHRNDVRVAIWSSSSRIDLWGFPSDISLVREMYAAAAVAMVRLGDAYLDEGRWRAQHMLRGGRFVPTTKQSARTSFYKGFYEGVGYRLHLQREQALQDAQARETADSVAGAASDAPLPISTALVMRDKEIEVSDVYARESGASRMWRGSTGAGHDSRAQEAGRRAAESASLTAQRAIGA